MYNPIVSQEAQLRQEPTEASAPRPCFTDEQLLNAVTVHFNDPKFTAALEEWPKDTEAAYRLAAMILQKLAFYSGKNAEQMARIFKEESRTYNILSSERYRWKTYRSQSGDRELSDDDAYKLYMANCEQADQDFDANQLPDLIESAINLTTEVYTPRAKVRRISLTPAPPMPANTQARTRQAESTTDLQGPAAMKILEGLECFKGTDGAPYAKVPVNGTYSVSQLQPGPGPVADFLRCQFFEQTGKLLQWSVTTNAIEHKGSMALSSANTRDFSIRTAKVGNVIYVDLADAHDTVVTIDPDNPDDWEVTHGGRVPVLFKRPPGIGPLPKPERAEDVSIVEEIMSIFGVDEGPALLATAFLLQALRRGTSYAALCVKGAEGSGKTTLCKALQRILDPSQIGLRSIPKTTENFFVAANETLLLVFDNVTPTNDEQANALCLLATGGGYGTRKFYCNSGEFRFNVVNPVILNGIPDIAAKRPDLQDRMIYLGLPPLSRSKRKTEEVLWKHFDDRLPVLLGALYSAIAHGLREEDMQLDGGRMASVWSFVNRCERGIPRLRAGAFNSARVQSTWGVIAGTMEDNPFAAAVLDLAKDGFDGTATDLLLAAQKVRPDFEKLQNWPSNAVHAGKKLRELEGILNKQGVGIKEHQSGGKRLVRLQIG